MKMNIRPAFRFQFHDLLKSCAGFFAVILVLVALIPALSALLGGDANVSFSGYGVIAAIFMFVLGIVAPRSYIRLGIQMGVSRGTSFVTQLLSLLAAAALLSVAGELLTGVAQLIFSKEEGYFFSDMYQLMYQNDVELMGFAGHLLSVAFNVCMCLCAYICGMFFTLLFWRLNKVFTIVAVIAMIVLFNVGLNSMFWMLGIPWVYTLLHAFGVAVIKGPGALILLFLAVAAIFAVIEWLMLRRAFIRASK